MNMEEMKKLRDALQNLEKLAVPIRGDGESPVTFNMGDYAELDVPGHVCGTSACLAGIAVLNSAEVEWVLDDDPAFARLVEKGTNYQIFRIDDRARSILDLSDSESSFMFLGSWSPLGLRATVAEALQYLDLVIESGHVAWNCYEGQWVECRAVVYCDDEADEYDADPFGDEDDIED